METENIYLLLELRIDPPENNPKVIRDAVKKKQTQWSRYRNHPTKALEAKKYIGMIPKIKRVMSDPKLRMAEARKAKEILAKRDSEKLEKIDGHLEILISQGEISEQKIEMLSEMHSMDEEKIRDWVAKRENTLRIFLEIDSGMGKNGMLPDKKITSISEKFNIEKSKIEQIIQFRRQNIFKEIDKYLAIRIRRGYITETAIADIAKLYGIQEEQIIRRVKCPIRKESKKVAEKKQPLEKTIEKLINDNLKIVGKSSLYEFLGVAPSSSLEHLQTRAKEKEAEIRNISKKDAKTTAGGVLSGYCITIFKTDMGRNSYEMSRMYQNLVDLNRSIELAGVDGKIGPESLKILTRSALQIGMNPDEAFDYISDYCKKKNWQIASSPKKKRKKLMMLSAVIGFVLLLVLAWIGWGVYQSGKVQRDYEKAIEAVEKQRNPEKKIVVIDKYLRSHKQNNFTREMRNKKEAILLQIDERDYKNTIAGAESLLDKKAFQKAADMYQAYLDKHGDSGYAKEIRLKMTRLIDLVDERDYKSIVLSAGNSFDEKVQAFNTYLYNHPKGKYAANVQKMLDDLMAAQYQALRSALVDCEKTEAWKRCIELCTMFIDNFKDDERIPEIKSKRAKFENKLENRTMLTKLKQQADSKGEDFEAAKNVYQGYLEANPESSSYMRRTIAREMLELDRKQKVYFAQLKEWEDTSDYAKDKRHKVTNRIRKVRNYISANSSGRYVEDAKAMLSRLEMEKQGLDEEERAKREEKDWLRFVSYMKNTRISLENRIGEAEKFLTRYSRGKHGAAAKKVLDTLKTEKRLLDEKLRGQRQLKAKLDAEMNRIRSLLKNTGGRFVDNGNGTITDRKTGLMWCMIDSSFDLGKCIDYYAATNYVKSLNTGGYRNWRLPTALELVGIYKTKPFFPQGNASWFWSSDVVLHGWNKNAYVVTTKRELAWKKDLAPLDSCGAVRAVRK